VEVRELHALLCKRIEIWCIDFSTVTTNVRPAQVVGYYKQEIGSIAGFNGS
jgi:hypothetical protein